MKQPKSQQQEAQTILDHPIDLPMETEVNRKRQISFHENDVDNEMSSSKRPKILSGKPRKKLMSRRRNLVKKKLSIEEPIKLQLKPPQAAQVENRKGKLDLVSDNDSENEDLLKTKLLKVN